MADAPSRKDLWIPVTIRVAWELYTSGFRVSAQILKCAREHVLRSLPPDISIEVAERYATIYTHDFVDRFQQHRYRRPNIDPDIGMDIPRRWCLMLQEQLDSVGKVVFRFHYRDGFNLELVSERSTISIKRIVRARDRIYGVLKRLVAQEDIDIHTWGEARIDLLLTRIANIAEESNLRPGDILSEEGRALVSLCPRMNRAYRLMKNGIISDNDLQEPRGETVPEGRLSLLSLLLHPDARHHSHLITEALSPYATSISGDAWLIPYENLPDVHDALSYLSEVNTPPRHYLRGALISGPGRWYKGVLLGLLPVRALEAARSRPWGEIDGIDELPPPLPPPPRASFWWLGAVSTFAVSVFVLLWALSPEEVGPHYPIEIEFYQENTDIRARFDVDDLAYIDILTAKDGKLNVVHHALFKDKGLISTGDGRYFFREEADYIAIISSRKPIESLPAIAQVAQGDLDPMAYLQERVLELQPDAHIIISPPEDEGILGF